MKSWNILVIGDVIFDRYIHGDVIRVNPEAPCPLLSVNGKNWDTLGGAANVAMNIKSLGSVPYLIGTIGSDLYGVCVKNLVKKNKLDSYLLNCDKITTTKTRYITKGQQILRVDREDTAEIDNIARQILLDSVMAVIDSMDAILVADYAKGVISRALMRSLVALSEQYGIPLMVDPKPDNWDWYNGASLVKPNKLEYKPLVNLDVFEYMESNNIGMILRTEGSEGMTLYQREGKRTNHIDACAQDVYDVTGAGDTVLATFAVAYLDKGDAIKAARIANVAASKVIQRLGVSTVTPDILD